LRQWQDGKQRGLFEVDDIVVDAVGDAEGVAYAFGQRATLRERNFLPGCGSEMRYI
jgi:hypothetical protein